jgi:hypothetical protein
VPPHFLRTLRYLCDEAGALLIFDEVQVGARPHRHLWAHEAAGVEPDLMTLAKPLAGGLPMGAVLLTSASRPPSAAGRPRDHLRRRAAGGQPRRSPSAAASATRPSSPRCAARATLARRPLGALALRREVIRDPRPGMIWGIETGTPPEVVARALEPGLLLCTAGPQVVRIVPPLTIDRRGAGPGAGPPGGGALMLVQMGPPPDSRPLARPLRRSSRSTVCAGAAGVIVRPARHAQVEPLINAFAAQNLMLPKTHEQLARLFREFVVAVDDTGCSAAARCASTRVAGRDRLARRRRERTAGDGPRPHRRAAGGGRARCSGSAPSSR